MPYNLLVLKNLNKGLEGFSKAGRDLAKAPQGLMMDSLIQAPALHCLNKVRPLPYKLLKSPLGKVPGIPPWSAPESWTPPQLVSLRVCIRASRAI